MTKKGSWLKTFAWLIVALVIYAGTGAYEQWLFPIPDIEFDTLADTTEWETYQVPSINLSLKLPPGTTIYTRESIAKGNVNNDENFDDVKKLFDLPERRFIAINPDELLYLSFAHYNEHRIFPFNDYKNYTEEQLDKTVEYSLDDGALEASYFTNNGNVFTSDIRPLSELAPTRCYYSAYKHGNDYLFSFLYDNYPITVSEDVQNAIVNSIEIT